MSLNNEIYAIKDTIVSTIPAKSIYIFGSYAKGTQNTNSDYDFYVIVPDYIHPIEATWKIREAIDEQTRGIDMLVGTESKFNKYKNVYSIEKEVFETGVKIYG